MIESSSVRARLGSAMWVLFGLSLVPLVWQSARTATYFALHPDVLPRRDPALESLGVHAAFRLAAYPFVPAAVLALFFLVVGPRAVRLRLALFVAGFIGVGMSGKLFAFDSPGRLVTDLASCLVPFVLALASVRRSDRGARELHAA